MNQQETEKKKMPKWLWIVIGGVLAAGLTVGAVFLFGGKKAPDPGNETSPAPIETEADTTEEDPWADEPDYSGLELYWNVDRNQYGKTETGISTRTVDQDDGYYHVLFACNGRQIERRVEDKKLLNRIDSMDVMGLVFDEKNIVIDAIDVEEFTGGYLYKEVFVTEIDENGTVYMASNADGNGMEYENAFEGAPIYDVSGFSSFIGEPIKVKDLKAEDLITAIRSEEGPIAAVYVIERNVIPVLYWNMERMWNSDILNTTREPNAEGVYEIKLASEGKQITVYTKDRNHAYEIDRWPERIIALDLDEDNNILRVKSAYGETHGGSFGSWSWISEIGDDGHVVSVRPDQGLTYEGKMAENCRFFNVSGVGGPVGEEVEELHVGDRVHGMKNRKGEIIYMFIVGGRTVDSKLYWNMTRMYDTTKKETTRTPDGNGLYVFELAVDGGVQTFKTASRELASQMDSYAARCFGVKIENGLITEVYTQKDVTGAWSIASWFNITKINEDGSYVAQKYGKTASDYGQVKEFTLADGCQIVNVSELYRSHAGEYTTLQVGDRIHACPNTLGNPLYVYVNKRTVNTEIYWNVAKWWDTSKKTSTRTKEKDGYYHLIMATQGRHVELRTTSKELVDKIDERSDRCMGLVLSGDVIAAMYPATQVTKTQYGSSGSWYKVKSIEGRTLHLYSESDPSKTADVTMAANAEVYNVGGEFTFSGEKTTVRVGDKVHCLRNLQEEATVVFVVERKSTTATRYCPDCGKNVTFRTYIGKFESYSEDVIHLYLAGDRMMYSQMETFADKAIHFDLNGHTLTGGEKSRILYVKGTNAVVSFFDTSSGHTGVIKSGPGRPLSIDEDSEKGAAIYQVYNSSKLYFKDLTLDFSAMNVKESAGALHSVYAATLELTNVKIIAGKAESGAAIYTDGKTVLNNVTVTGGVNETAGSVTVTKNGVLTLSGKVSITGGKNAAGEKANLYLTDGKKVTLGNDFASGSSIGISMEKPDVFTANEMSAYKAAFTPDAESGEISVTDAGALKLAVGIRSISFNPSKLTVQAGVETKLTPVIVPKTAANYPLVYESADPSAVAANEDGSVLGLKVSSTPVKVTVRTPDNSASATVDVVVTSAPAGAHYHAVATNAAITAEQGAKVVWTAWTKTDSLPKESGLYYLANDVTLTDQASIPAGANVRLCLNGHTVKAAGGKRAFYVNGTEAKFVICDCSSGEKGAVTGGGQAHSENGGLGYVNTDAVLELYGGTLKNGITTKNGGNVYIAKDAHFNMYGGLVTGGESTEGSGGNVIAATGAYFTMTGGSLTNGKVMTTGWHTGGNLCIWGGETILRNAVISGGTSAVGGNIHTDGPLTLENVTLSGGNATTRAGNLHCDLDAHVTVTNCRLENGRATGETSTGGNLYSQAMSFTMTGTTVQGGTAVNSANAEFQGGVTVIDGCTFTASGTGTQDVRIQQASSASVVKLNLTLQNSTFTGTTLVQNCENMTLSGTVKMGSASVKGLMISNAAHTQHVAVSGLNGASRIYLGALKDGVVIYGGAANLASFINTVDLLAASGQDVAIELFVEPVPGGHNHCVCGLEVHSASQTNPALDASLGHKCKVVTWTEWTSTTDLPTASGSYYLANDVTLTAGKVIGANADVKLCLNGHTVTAAPAKRIYTVDQLTSRLLITDCSAGKSGTLKGSGSAYSGNGGVISMNNGAVTELYAGTITGGRATNNGGNIYISKNCKLIMYGGTVTAGNAETGSGGNIIAAVGSFLEIYGGSITNGSVLKTSWHTGGNICIWDNSVVTIKNAVISGGTAYVGGNVHTNAAVTMENVTLSGGSAENRGGNLHGDKDSTVTIRNSRIENGRTNASSGYGGNAFLQGKSLTLTGSTLTGGQSEKSRNLELRAGTVLIDGSTIGNGSHAVPDVRITQGTESGLQTLAVTFKNSVFQSTVEVNTCNSLTLGGKLTMGSSSVNGLVINNDSSVQRISVDGAGLTADSFIRLNAKQAGTVIYGGAACQSVFSVGSGTLAIEGSDLTYSP